MTSRIVNSAGHRSFADEEPAALERRLFRSMCAAVVLAVLASAPFAPWRVTTGLLLGGVLSLFNHHWMRSSIMAAFSVGVTGKRPRIRMARYVLRYVVIGAIVFVAYKLNLVSVAATLVGMCSFVVAIFVEAFMQIYFSIVYREET